MGTDRSAAAAGCHRRRWESGALAHAVTDPFGQGPVPWLRGTETYFDDSGQIVPWYVDQNDTPPGPSPHKPHGGRTRIPNPRSEPEHINGPRAADDVHRQIKGFTTTGATVP